MSQSEAVLKNPGLWTSLHCIKPLEIQEEYVSLLPQQNSHPLPRTAILHYLCFPFSEWDQISSNIWQAASNAEKPAMIFTKP